SFSIFCGRIEWASTSAPAISRHSASAAAGFLRSSTSERLLRLSPMNSAAMLGERAGPVWRGASPSGASILMTSAPMSPSICVASGPATTDVKSRTRMPANGPAMAWSRFGSCQVSGKLRYHVLGKQTHRFLRLGEIERAEIDLQRGVLEFAHGVFEAADDGLDLVGGADPGAAAFDLAFERGILHPADRHVVAFVILRRRA